MAGNLVKSVLLKIVAEDGDSEAKLDKISEKADELGRKHPDIKVKIDSAAASAKLAVLRAELKATAADEKKAADASASFSDRLRSLGSSGGAFTGLSTGMKDAAASGSKFGLVMAGLNIATGLGEPLMAGLIVTTGALAAGLVSAGAGLGIFGLVAKGVYGQVSGDVSAYTTAQNAAIHATTAAARNTALKQMQNAFNGLTGSQKEFAMSIVGAQNAWQNFVAKATPGVAAIAKQGFALLPKIFAAMQPFLAPTEHALSGIISSLGKGIDSSGFKSFMDTMAKNTGPMITSLAKAIGNVIVGIGGILKAFMPVTHQLFGGLDGLTKKFAEWGQTLTQHSGFKSLMAMFHSETPLAVSALTSLIGILKQVVSSMTGLDTFSNSRMLLQLADPILKFTNALLKAHPEIVWLLLYLKLAADGGKKLSAAFQGVSAGLGVLKSARSGLQDLSAGFSNSAAAASSATGIWGTFGGKLSSVVTSVKEWSIWSKIAAAATKVWTGIQIAFDAVMDANPIALIVIAVIALGAALAILIIKVKPVRDFFKAAFHDILVAVSAVWNWVKGHWPLLAAVLLGPIGVALVLITGHLHSLENVFSSAWKAITRVVSSAWNAIMSVVTTAANAVGRLVARLWHVVEGLFSGGSGNILHIAMSLWDRLVSGQLQLGEEFTGLVERLVVNVVHVFAGLPDRVMGAISGLAGMLFSAGAHIIESLASGIMSAIGSVGHAIGSVVGEITSHLPFSPAKKGPLSGRGSPDQAGMRIASMLGQGMTEGLPDVRTAAMHLAGAAGIGGGAGARLGAPAAATGPLVIEIHPPAGAAALGPEFMTALANGIRVRGGDPRILTRKVVLA